MALVPIVLVWLMASTGCPNQSSVGSSGGAAAVMYGDPPASGALVRPVGVAVSGDHIGQTLMVAAAAAAGGTLGKLTADAVRAVGNEPLAMTGDPCKDEPPGSIRKIAAWRRTSLHPPVYLDCAQWEAIRHYNRERHRFKGISVVLRCISRVIGLGKVTPGIGQAAKYEWEFPATGNSLNRSIQPGGTATILTDENGRITSVYVDGRWSSCAGIAV